MSHVKLSLTRFFVLVTVLCYLLSSVCMAETMAPVTYTAYTSLYWLREAGVPEAAEFSNAIGDKKVSLAKDTVQNYDELAPVNQLYIEMRYAALNEYIIQNGYRNTLDIACGFAPRSLAMSRRGIYFVGADLAPAIAEVNKIVPECLSDKQKKFVEYAVADSTDKQSLMQAADKLNGRICITMDGLMMYLSREEQATVLQNIKTVLKKHGGAYITSDFSAREFVKASTNVVYDDKNAHEIYRHSAEMYEKTASADFDKAFFSNAGEAQAFIESQGLKVKRIPLVKKPVALHCAKAFNIEQYSKLETLKNKALLGEITLPDNG